jgi:hypothetical protein
MIFTLILFYCLSTQIRKRRLQIIFDFCPSVINEIDEGFSKKWENLNYALALHFAYYNFCRIHKTIRCTPAMEARITKTVWTLKDLIGVE